METKIKRLTPYLLLILSFSSHAISSSNGAVEQYEILRTIGTFDGVIITVLVLIWAWLKPAQILEAIKIVQRKKLVELDSELKKELAKKRELHEKEMSKESDEFKLLINKKDKEFQQELNKERKDFEKELEEQRNEFELYKQRQQHEYSIIQQEMANKANKDLEEMKTTNTLLVHQIVAEMEMKVKTLLQEKSQESLKDILGEEFLREEYLVELTTELEEQSKKSIATLDSQLKASLAKMAKHSDFLHNLMVNYWLSISKCFDASYHLQQSILRTFDMEKVDGTRAEGLIKDEWSVVLKACQMQLRDNRQVLYENKPFFSHENIGDKACEIGSRSAEILRKYSMWAKTVHIDKDKFDVNEFKNELLCLFVEHTEINKKQIKALTKCFYNYYESIYEIDFTVSK